MARILLADNDDGTREWVAGAFAAAGQKVVSVGNGQEAAKLLDEQGFDLLVTELEMPGIDGMELLQKVRVEQPETEVILLTPPASAEASVEAMRQGAFECLQKPIRSSEELKLLASRALEWRQLRASRDAEERQRVLPSLQYGDPAMAEPVHALDEVTARSTPVLFFGEAGTGKEVFARALHARSARSDKPFVAIDCALETFALERELCGYERDTFDADAQGRRGGLELAEGGTLFLDGVDACAPAMQEKLWRILRSQNFRRLGSSRAMEVDVRWVASSRSDLRELAKNGAFLPELAEALSETTIRLPPLRERRADILPMANALLKKAGQELKRPNLRLSEQAEQHLIEHRWPGNVRELANALERAALSSEADTVDGPSLGLGGANRARPEEVRPLAELEREAIYWALKSVNGNRRRAAELLGIGERTMYDKLKRYGVAS